jgi:unsaturated chondroitin disaccharide hydrolase
MNKKEREAMTQLMAQTKSWMDEAWERTAAKVSKTSRRIGATFPHITVNGKYDSTRPEWWTSGFWPGLLWLMYRETGDEKFAEYANLCENQLDEVLENFYQLDHDMGFIWSLSAVAQYKLTGNEQSKRRGLIAASHLAGRFNLKGNFIRAWPDNATDRRTGWAIIDCTMNLPLLYWASETLEDPRFKFIAMAHADTVLREFVREDGSVRHIVCFDPNTGERVEVRAGQGYSADSAWSRGNAWALHGLALSYRYTREQRYLDAVKRVAHFFISALPEDSVPFWDFRAPKEEQDCVDTSAAACAASGLLEIANWVPEFEAALYRNAGERIIKSLYENYGAWDNEEEEGLITKGTIFYKSERYPNHIPIIYGDFFFVEALTKLKGQKEVLW